MIVNDRITDYLHSLESSQGVLLDTIEKAALDGRVPIIRRETASLLRTLVAALKPSQILEIGTAVGYSALLMCQTMPRACHITTIEKYEKRIPVARENFKKAGEESRITLLEGDADQLLGQLEEGRPGVHGCGQGPVSALAALSAEADAAGGRPYIGQRAPGRRYRGITVCGAAQEQDHPQQDAGIPPHIKAYGGV